MNKSESINELATALAKAQGELQNASKSSQNNHFKSSYADLAEVLNTLRPSLSKNGLSVSQFPSYQNGIVSVDTLLMHSSGQWLSGNISVPIGKQDAQSIGSATTYCRRYSLAAVVGIAQEDDDANSAAGNAPANNSSNAQQIQEPDWIGLIADISNATDILSLKRHYETAYRLAKTNGNAKMMERLEDVKEKRKAELSPQQVA